MERQQYRGCRYGKHSVVNHHPATIIKGVIQSTGLTIPCIGTFCFKSQFLIHIMELLNGSFCNTVVTRLPFNVGTCGIKSYNSICSGVSVREIMKMQTQKTAIIEDVHVLQVFEFKRVDNLCYSP